MNNVIGVDLDNTIVSYDDVIYSIALERNLIPTGVSKNKKNIRDRIRERVNGEEEWTRLQAVAYGERIDEAQIIDGAQLFFQLCRQHNIKTYIISQKRQFAKYDQTNTDMRLAALRWMTKNSFFEEKGLGLSPQDVIFKSTRREKVNAIGNKNCTHFIDDLIEVLLDSNFPSFTNRILFDRESVNEVRSEVQIINSWKAICEYFFNH